MKKTPLLPAEELHAFVAQYFGKRQAYQNAVEKHGSPLWILEPAVLKEKADLFSRAFNRNFNTPSFYFAMKSNNLPDVSAAMLESGFGLDVSSGEELKTALALNARDIVFSGPGKTLEELTLAVRHRDRTIILLDSFGELERLKTLVPNADGGAPIRVGIRLMTTPEGLWKKFGIPPEELPRFWHQVKNSSTIDFQGLQFHSSWNLTPDRQVGFIRFLGTILKHMPKEFNQRVKFIDIGGGYWPGEGEWVHFCGTPEGIGTTSIEPNQADTNPTKSNPAHMPPHYRIPGTPIEEFSRILSREIQAHLFPFVNARICFEPGRWICHSAMQFLFTVIDKKDRDLVITDAGTNVIGWERFEMDYFPILNLSCSELIERPCRVLGSLCTPHDVWGYSYFGMDIQPGDLLMIPCQGAYTYSLGQRFIKSLPKVVRI